MSITGRIVAPVAGREYELVCGLAAIEEIEERLDVAFVQLAAMLEKGLKTRTTKEVFAALSGTSLDDINANISNVQHIVEMQTALVKAINAAAIPTEEGESGADATNPPG